MFQSKISFSYLNRVPSVSCSDFFFFFVCDSVFSPWTCGLKMQWLWVLCFYVSLFYYYHHRHHHYYYYHLFWGDSYVLISLSWWNAVQIKAWECLWYFPDFSWASLLFAWGWDWALPARSRAVQPLHIIPLPISGCVLCPPGSKRKWERMASQSVGKMTHWIIFCISNITLEFLPMYRYSQAASLMYLYLFTLRNASVNTLTYFFYILFICFFHVFFSKQALKKQNCNPPNAIPVNTVC